jgi:hypothetical protein
MDNHTVERVKMTLRLYELRREARLREARDWVVAHFRAATPEELMQKYPPGSDENAFLRMVTSFWDLCAGIANRGLVDDDLFFTHSGEGWIVWQRVKHLAPQFRERYKNPLIYAELERFAQRYEQWLEQRAPGSLETLQKMMQQAEQARAQAGGS